MSDRQLEVLNLIAKGKTNKEIARTMNRSVKTVEFHVAGIFAFLDATNRAEAVAKGRNLLY